MPKTKALDPIQLFESWLADAQKAGIHNAEAMTLATSTRGGIPSARMVLFKGMLRGGFAFYTNYQSRKSRELDANPRAALVFHWDSFERQIRVEGKVERCTKTESDRYFASRARESRLGAWASPQSSVIPDRAELELNLAMIDRRFAGKNKVPRPIFWGGYRVVPERIEFWQGRVHRLHERTLYTRKGRAWTASLLAP
jgi:pyridoxamine 5'-phosphate oxidase